MRATRSWGAVLLVAALGSAAAAQTPQEQVDKLFAEGRDLLVNKNDAKAACEKFEAAIALDSTAPGVMLNLGLCYEKLEKFATSLYWFRKAQAAASEGKAPEFEQAAKDHTVVLVEKVAIGKIDTTGLPADAEINIEGRRVAPADYARIELDHGPNRVEARAAGKRPFSTVHQVSSREGGTITIGFQTEVVYETIDAGSSRRKLAYVTGGTAIGLGVTCLVLNLYWAGKQDEKYTSGLPTAEDDGDVYKRKMKIYGTSLFVGAVALGAASVVLYVTAPGIEKREVQQQARLVPYVDTSGAGVVWSGRF